MIDIDDPEYDYEQEEVPEEQGFDESKLRRALQWELSHATDEVNALEPSFQTALDYYEGNIPAPAEDEEGEEEPDYSDYVSEDVRNAIEASLAEIMPGFYGDQPVVFMPNGPTDEAQADQESRIVNFVIMTANKGYHAIARAFKDAMLYKDGFIKVYWSDRMVMNGRRLEGLPAEQLPQVMQSGAKIQGIDAESGTFTVDVMEPYQEGPMAEWVPGDQIRVNSDHADVSLDMARFVSHVRTIPASDLVAFGVPKEVVDELQSSEQSNVIGNTVDDETETGDDSTRPILVAESYYRIDVDGDGIAELRRIISAGGSDGADVILEDRPWPSQPFAHGVVFFAPRGWRGVSLTERLDVIQDYKSDMMRQIMDAGWRNLNQRYKILERGVNAQDMAKTRRGGYVRVRSMDAIDLLPDVNVSHQSFQLLETMDKVRRESGGGAIDTAPQSQEIGVDSAHGLERIMSAIEQTGAAMAKNLAETMISEVYLKMHAVLRAHWPGTIQARTQGTWLSQVPTTWSVRHATEIAVGLSVGTRLQQAAATAQVITQQSQDAAAGNTLLISPRTQYNARADFARLSGMQFADRYWVNPESPEGEQQAQKQAEQQQQIQQQQLMTQQQQQEFMKELEGIKAQALTTQSEIKAQMDNQKQMMDYLLDIMDKRLKLIDMNAKYDKEEVPDTMPGEGEARSKAEDVGNG